MQEMVQYECKTLARNIQIVSQIVITGMLLLWESECVSNLGKSCVSGGSLVLKKS